MKRKIIQIDESRCDGCGLCMPNCPEGALQLLDGKARLVNDRFCDGLGACLGHCPQGAITIEEREAEPYNETLVMEKIVRQGPATIQAHLEHLKDHGETGLYNEAVLYLKKTGTPVPIQEKACGCPGAAIQEFKPIESALTHWPVQMHLISPLAPQYQGKDVLLSADCVAYSMPGFHSRYLSGKSLAIACPKLDDGQDVYLKKLVALIDEARINTLHVMIMQVPCCRGLLNLALDAAQQAQRRVPIKCSIVSLQGEILKEDWVQ